MDSIWQQDVEMPRFPRLEEDIHTDVLVVGGGLAGLLCAWKLRSSGVDCVLVEQGRIMGAVSGRTTAKLTSQHGLIYGKLMKRFGAEKARMYWQVNEDALSGYKKLAQQAEIDLKLENNYVYATGATQTLEAEMAACERLGVPALWRQDLHLPFPVTGAVCFPDQARFHPMKLAAHVAQNLRIYENTKAMEFLGNRVRTPRATVTAEKIIVATHFPMLNRHGFYFLKLYQQRSYVIALENASLIEGMYLDSRENGLSLRQAGPWLLLGGGGHRTGKKGPGWKLPELAARQYFPQARIVARWATQDCMTLDGMPYIGRYSKGTPNLYVATGFGKWGMSSAMAAATVLSDLIRDKDNPYAALFSPSRSILHRQLLYNGVETTVNLLRPTVPRCPHLGCALKWNAGEHSWDCPCHGSRFGEDGKLRNGPATDDMKRPPRA